MKKKFNITQTSSGKYMTWVSEGHGNNRRKAKITADTPEDVIVKATKWLRNIEKEKNVPFTVKEAMNQFIDVRSKVLESTTLCNYREITRNKLHIFASTAAMLNVPEKYAMEMGGWSTPDVYKNVYQETYDSERTKADSVIDDYFNGIIGNSE